MRLYSIAAGGALLLLGCAGRATATCEAVSNDIVAIAGQPVLSACGVDRAVQAPEYPRLTYTPTQPCGNATVAFVVNAEGRVIPSTIRVTASNDRALSDAMIAALIGMRFTPAQKNGAPVAQLSAWTIDATASSTAAGGATGRSC